MHRDHSALDADRMTLSMNRDEVVELYRALVSASAQTPLDGFEDYDLDHPAVLELKDQLRAHIRGTQTAHDIDRSSQSTDSEYSWG